MLRKSIFLAALALLMAAVPVAAKKAEKKAVVADTAEKFELLVEAIRGEMAPGKRYEFLQKSDREKVNHALDKMAAILANSGSVDAMSEDDRIKLFNEQEFVNGLLARNADDRLVCTHVAPVGSHLPVRKCRTAREINEDRSAAQRELRNAPSQRYQGRQ